MEKERSPSFTYMQSVKSYPRKSINKGMVTLQESFPKKYKLVPLVYLRMTKSKFYRILTSKQTMSLKTVGLK